NRHARSRDPCSAARSPRVNDDASVIHFVQHVCISLALPQTLVTAVCFRRHVKTMSNEENYALDRFRHALTELSATIQALPEHLQVQVFLRVCSEMLEPMS